MILWFYILFNLFIETKLGLAVIFTATIYLNAFFYPFFILNSDINSEILIRNKCNSVTIWACCKKNDSEEWNI